MGGFCRGLSVSVCVVSVCLCVYTYVPIYVTIHIAHNVSM